MLSRSRKGSILTERGRPAGDRTEAGCQETSCRADASKENRPGKQLNMEAAFINAVVYIATGAAVIKFALFEWEGVVRAWTRVSKSMTRRRSAKRQSVS